MSAVWIANACAASIVGAVVVIAWVDTRGRAKAITHARTLDALVANVEGLEDTLAARDRTITDLRAALETAEGEARGLQVQWNFAQTVNEDLFEENTRLEALSATLTAERDELRGALKRSEKDWDDARSERDTLRDELAHAVSFRGAGGRAVSLAVWREQRAASEAVGPAMAERL